jgi:large subunit ribosomal protein L6
MVAGVTMGFKKELELVGIGYRAEKKGDDLILALGFSHPVEFKAPAGITLEVADKTKVTVAGIDKQLVGQTAARLRALRPPEPYKGKGIRYASEVIKKKAGKAGKVGAGAFGPPAK